MRNLVSTYIDQFRQDRQKQIKLGVVLAALAVLVAGVVFWQLHSTGVAMTNEVFCGQEEHIHDDACYEELLICDSEDEEHVHDDTCFETVLTCQIPEHTHTVECLIDETADVETAGDWEATLPEELSGIWADDVVAIAESQVGYTESEQNFQLAEDGETHQGYTRYGAWYGNEYGDWDAMFVSFCLNYAGVPEDVIPENSGAWALSVALDEEGLYIEDAEFTPEAGGLVFFDRDEDGRVDTVGIVTALDNEDGEEDTLTVIEGNSSDAVEENTYEAGEDAIVAFAVLPDQSDEEDNVFEIIGEAVKLTAEGEDYIVTVTYGENAELPEDVELVVSEYENDSETFEDRYAEAMDRYKLDEESLEDARLFNISLMADGEEVEPAADVQVEISLIGQDDADYQVIHFSDVTQGVAAESSFTGEAMTISFITNSFSDFMVLATDDGVMLVDDAIMPLAEAVAGQLDIFKYDSSENGLGGYYEGYYVWVPNGTYDVVKDMDVLDSTNTYNPNGRFYYWGESAFVAIEGLDNWYESDYSKVNEDSSRKYEAAQVVVEGDVEVDGVMGGYVYFVWDDREYHDLYNICLILDEVAPDVCNGDKDLRNDSQYSEYLYEFVHYEYSVEDTGALEGAVFTLYGEHYNVSGVLTDTYGYAYFTVDEDGYHFAGWCASYDEETGYPDGVTNASNYTCFIESGADGHIYMDGFPTDSWINFTLTEIKAPSGYEQLEDPIHFTLEYNGNVDENDGGTTSGGTISVADDPLVVDIYKYDTDNDEPLQGADFIVSRTVVTNVDDVETETDEYAIFSSDGTVEWTKDQSQATVVTSDEDGFIHIEKIDAGAYTLIEINPPEGYKATNGNGRTTFVVDVWGNVTYGTDGEGTIKVGNTQGKSTYSVNIYKYSTNDAEKSYLSGAEFVLQNDNDFYAVFVEEDDVYYFSEWTENSADATTLVSGVDGYIKLDAIEPGTYVLIETKAPDGYLLQETPIEFIVDAGGEITCSVWDEDSEAIAIENIGGITLPNTGGMGTWAFTAAGMVLIGGAGALLVSRKRRAVRS